MSTPDYSKYIKNSFELVKKNRWLWVFAALVGSGGGYSISSGWSDLFEGKKENTPVIPKDISMLSANVLGDATSSLKEWFEQIPPQKLLYFVLLVTALIVFIVAISLIITSWAKGSLIKGIEMTNNKNKVDLESVSPYGFKYLRKMLRFTIIVIMAMVAVGVIVPLFWMLLLLVFSGIKAVMILWIVFGVITLPFLIISFFVLSTLVNLYGERLIILKGMEANEAFREAIIISRKTLLASLILGIINKIIGFMVGLATLLILAVMVILPAYLAYSTFGSNPTFSVLLSVMTSFAFLIFIFISTIIRTSLVTFGYSNWNQLFNDYFEKHD